MASATSIMTIVYQLPQLIIAVIGLVLSLQQLPAHRRKAQLAAGAFAILLGSVVIRVIMNFLTSWMVNTGSGVANAAFDVMWPVQTVLSIVTWVLILLALFRPE